MKTSRRKWTSVLAASLFLGMLAVPAGAATKPFTLSSAVPDDVFLLVTGRCNPEREFLDRYWGEVFEAFSQSGISGDVMALFGTFLGDEQMAEVDRLKEKASKLLAGVNWKQLFSEEVAFAERMPAAMRVGQGTTMGPPDMVLLCRGTVDTSAGNFAGIVAIMEGAIEEINKAADGGSLAMEKTSRAGAEIATVNLLAMAPGAPSWPISVARRDDLVIVAAGPTILDEVLGLLKGGSSKSALAEDLRFKTAFSKLPAPEDSMVFFDMKAMLRPFHDLLNLVVEQRGQPGDVMLNHNVNGEANEPSQEAMKAYQEKNYQRALEFAEKAYEKSPNDSGVLYNLACFTALAGHKEKALDSLEKAVDGGYYCPGHIANDTDLAAVRDDERYKAALAKAGKLATEASASGQEGKAAVVKRVAARLLDVPGVLDYIASVEYTEGYTVKADTIAALVPDAKSMPIYPVFGKRAPATNFDRFLPEETMSFSVSGCIDLDELYKFAEDSFRAAGPPGEGLLAKWEQIQAQIGINVRKDVLGWINGDCVQVTLDDAQGWVMMIKVNDESIAREKVAAGVDFLTTKISEHTASNPMLAMMKIQKSPVQNEKLEGFENLFFGMTPQPMVWGVAEGHLIFGSSDKAVVTCLDTARGEHPGIRKNARLMSEAIVPDGPFGSVTLTDQRALGDNLAQVLGIVSMISGFATMAVPEDARPVIGKVAGMLAKLGPVVKKIDFYKSVATHTTFDGQVWYTRTATHYVAPAERKEAAGPAADSAM